MSKWQDIEQTFLGWLAGTATGSLVKVVLGATLAWVADNAANYDIPPVVLIAITAVVPIMINLINPADGRYGVGKTEYDPLAVED